MVFFLEMDCQYIQITVTIPTLAHNNNSFFFLWEISKLINPSKLSVAIKKVIFFLIIFFAKNKKVILNCITAKPCINVAHYEC